MNVDVRHAQLADAAEMARLAGQLGYPMATDEMARRLAALLPNDRHRIVVAPDADSLRGWAHVEQRFSLEGGDRSELMGLVVDARSRRSGVGRALLDTVEAWTAERGLASLTVRSNVLRGESHPFYEAHGYRRSKTPHVYVKAIEVNS